MAGGCAFYLFADGQLSDNSCSHFADSDSGAVKPALAEYLLETRALRLSTGDTWSREGMAGQITYLSGRQLETQRCCLG